MRIEQKPWNRDQEQDANKAGSVKVVQDFINRGKENPNIDMTQERAQRDYEI